ncbi:MAG: hypothetical protein LIV11_02425 [Bacillota bacterium]|nr:hypothetical protein [Bacillota bacterium]
MDLFPVDPTDDAAMRRGDLNPGFMTLLCRRWGETVSEKGPVDLFPVDPTDDAAMRRGDLEPGFNNSSPQKMG